MPASCVLIVALLTAAPEEAVPLIVPAEWHEMQAQLFSVAVEMEILDPREERFLRLEEFATDLRVVRRRARDLAGAPPLRDCKRFPDRHRAAELLRFNRAYRRGLEARQTVEIDREYLLKDAVRETDELHRIWELVREAGCEIYYVPVRRAALARLREMLGEAAYLAADVPSNVPEWRFADVR